jgi:formylglycine-generating enzyme required for sulfatase activity
MTPSRFSIRWVFAVAAAASVLVAAVLVLPELTRPTGISMGKGDIVWTPFSKEAMTRAFRSGRKVAIYRGDLARAPAILTDDATIASLLSRFVCLHLEEPHRVPPSLTCGVPTDDPLNPTGCDFGLDPGASLRLPPDLTVLELGRFLTSILTRTNAESLGIEWVPIPGGTYLTTNHELSARQEVAAFEISKCEVTNGQWHRYLRANEQLLRAAGKYESYVPRNWDWDPESGEAPKPPPDLTNRPVVFIPAMAAADFCRWAGGHLPAESEWEKAARGEFDHRTYPWGDDWLRETGTGDQAQRCNSEETGLGETLDVRAFAESDVSPYGVIGMAGNVSEFVLSPSGPCYRGGSYLTDRFDARIDESTPVPRDQDFTWRHVGFRVARSRRGGR